MEEKAPIDAEISAAAVRATHSFAQAIEATHSFARAIEATHSFAQAIEATHSFARAIQATHSACGSSYAALAGADTGVDCSPLPGFRSGVSEPALCGLCSEREEASISAWVTFCG